MVDDAQILINMPVQVFDAMEKRRYNKSDAKIMHAEIKVDDSIIMIADSTEKYPAYQLWIHVYVPDVESTFNKAIDYDCESIEKPIQKEGYPDCRGTFKDFSGNYWSIGTQL